MVSSVGPRPIVIPEPQGATPRTGTGFRDALSRASTPPPASTGVVGKILGSVADGQREMDRIIRLAQGGRTFSPAQLIGLQARVYRLSQELDLASKLVEKATSGVKQAMSTQV